MTPTDSLAFDHEAGVKIFMDGADTHQRLEIAGASDPYKHYSFHGVFEATPGSHTFSPRYYLQNFQDAAWTATAYFKNRTLEIKPV